MASTLALAHIEAEKRLRDAVARALEDIWRGLPGYDRANVDEWLAKALPVVTGGQRASVAVTQAYLARALERQPLGLSPEDVVGPALRAGAAPEEVYQRPFVTLWDKLGQGQPFADAFGAALSRVTSTGRMDVQLAMRSTLGAVQSVDEAVQGYQRVADADACAFCTEVDGAILRNGDAMPLHNGCGCGVEVLTTVRRATKPPKTVAIHQHGELGPVLADPAHEFTGPSDV